MSNSRRENICLTLPTTTSSPPPQLQAAAVRPPNTHHQIPSTLSWHLYLSHFLSTWNSRSFQFGAVLFLASTFPSTLLPLSIYALACAFSAICLAPWIGRAIDRGKRLPVVRFSIVVGRIAVIASCVGFWALSVYKTLPTTVKWALFTVLALLACVEKPCSVMNLVGVERDWVVVIAEGDTRCLQNLNARMRRIDLFCKLAGPLFIALIDGASTEVAIWLMLATNAICLPIEYFTIGQVYRAVPLLHVPKDWPSNSNGPETSATAQSRRARFLLLHCLSSIYRPLKFYIQHTAFLPSFTLSLLYLTVLSFSGQMLTYLLSTGYTAFHIALVRTLAVLFELSATWIAPRLMARIHPTRVGMWSLSWQMFWLAAGISFFWVERRPIVAASGLVAGTVFSRIGLWGFDLCMQFIVQEEVQGDQRGSFSSTEASLQNAFEMLSYVATIVWSRPEEFKFPVLISVGVTFVAGGLYGRFLRQRRGHLLHTPRCIKR